MLRLIATLQCVNANTQMTYFSKLEMTHPGESTYD
jgi:hypothetical protein